MKSINELEVWRSARLAAYTAALARFDRIALTPSHSHVEFSAAKNAIYTACGAPFGESALAEWSWWEFGQWETVN